MKGHRLTTSLLVSIAIFAVIVIAATGVINSIASVSGQAETEMVYNAVHAATLTCYAVEGAYPPNLEYLKKHYGLTYDEHLYTVIYDAFASNVFPDILVLEGEA